MTNDEFWALCEPGEARTVYVTSVTRGVSCVVQGIVHEYGYSEQSAIAFWMREATMTPPHPDEHMKNKTDFPILFESVVNVV